MKIDSEGFESARRASGISLEKAASICGVSRPTYTLRETNPGEYHLSDLVGLYEQMNEPGRKLLRDAVGSLFLA
jgi:transcriptional regulator with XRE-family HTH domain